MASGSTGDRIIICTPSTSQRKIGTALQTDIYEDLGGEAAENFFPLNFSNDKTLIIRYFPDHAQDKVRLQLRLLAYVGLLAYSIRT